MSCKDNLNIFRRFTYSVVTTTESFFYKLGVKIGHKPIPTIITCWCFVFLSAFGFLRFHQEKNPLKLWVPPHTTFIKDSEWLMSTLEVGYRRQDIIIKSDNVLTPKILQELYDIHVKVQTAKSQNNITWNDVCFKIPKLNIRLMSYFDTNDNNNSELDPSVKLNAALYCSFVETLGTECLEKSILELWDFNRTKINLLTTDDILYAINTYDRSFILNRLKNYEDLLGGIERNETGHIVSAKALFNTWLANLNFTAVDMDKVGNMAGTAEWATEDVLEWENTYLDTIVNISKQFNNSLYYSAGRSFSDISGATMFQDMDKLICGVFIMVLYVQFIISKYNCIENRILLGCVGMLTIAMAFIVGCGLCSLFGVYYGPVHTSLPFLLMGLGVDDMLVIIACWNDINYNSNNEKYELPHRIGLMLKHAGVSITVTSITDVVAFIIGASTILPCLQSFCIYAAVCVFMIYIFAVTFFTACFCLDQKRLENNRNGIVPCYQYNNSYIRNECSKKNFTNDIFHIIYDKIIFTKGGKLIVVSITALCLTFSMESIFKLEKHFDPTWFIPKQTYLYSYLNVKGEYYSNQGFEAGLYFGEINYTKEINNIKVMSDQLKSSDDIVTNVLSWVDPFREYVFVNFKEDIFNEEISDERFHTYLSMFLFSSKNAKYQPNFQFERKLECGAPAPKIIMSSIDFNFHPFSSSHEFIPAMHKLNTIVENSNFTTGDKFSTIWSKVYTTWITDELIDIEVMRNLELALACVMACTILLVADLQICLWIFCCVLITMVDVCGFMQRWGLTIDLVTCIGLELAIGLCVDYATHVGHTFLTIQNGSRRDRALTTVKTIGSAVLYGGISTLIGVFMLCLSTAYTFQAFFKIFLLVILFGLFHGVVLLPVILSWIGPKPYNTHKTLPQTDNELI